MESSSLPTRKLSPEVVRQLLVLALSLAALATTAYMIAASPGAHSLHAALAAIAGGWSFLAIHSVRSARSAADARRM